MKIVFILVIVEGRVVERATSSHYYSTSSWRAFGGGDPTFGGLASTFGGSLFGSGMQGAGFGNAAMIAGSAAFGGAIAELSGGDFGTGFVISGIVAAANHGLHGIDYRAQVRKHAKAVRAFMEDSGFSSEKVTTDVVTQKDRFFGKYYAKFVGDVNSYGNFFTGGYLDSYSSTHDAYISKSRVMNIGGRKNGISKTLAVKYYPSRANSIGLTQTGVNHYYEAFFEGLDGKVREWTGYDNVIYDMHGYNSNFYLRFRKLFR